MSELYRFNETDKQVLTVIGRWVKRLAASNSTPPGKLVSVVMVHQVLSRVPQRPITEFMLTK
jgi:hypothetical protein